MDSMNQSDSQLNLSRTEKKQRYLDCLEKLSTLGHDSVDNEERIKQTSKVLDEAGSLASANDISTTEARLDSLLLRRAGELALSSTRQIEANTNVYSAAELAQHIRENHSAWAFSLPRRVPPAGFLHGAFDPAPPELRARAPRRRVERRAAAPLKKPQTVDRLEPAQEDTAMVEKFRQFVRQRSKGGPLSYFDCVLDPASFARSVQNIYYVSFLVRDGKVAVYVDEALGIPMIRSVAQSESDRAARERDISQENQFIVSLDMARWQRLVDAFGIKSAMMVLQ